MPSGDQEDDRTGIDLRRLAPNFNAAQPLLGIVTGEERDVPVTSTDGVVLTAASARLTGVVLPDNGAVLLVRLDFAADLPAAVTVLQQTCFKRKTLRLGPDSIRLDEDVIKTLPVSLQTAFASGLDRDVHQVLMPGSDLRAELGTAKDGDTVYDAARVMQLVYRENCPFRPDTGDLRKPAELNRPPNTICQHGRGVTVLDGAAEHIEWGVVLVACELVSALGRLRRIRVEATEELGRAKLVDPVRSQRRRELAAARKEHGDIARRLGDLQVDLSFGVEQYIDSLRVPEIVLQSYRDSLATTLGLTGGAATTADMLSRLEAVLDTRRDELAAAEARFDQNARWAWAAMLTYATVVAIPAGTWVVDTGQSLFILTGLAAAGLVLFCAVRWWPRRWSFGSRT
jgi:hypothetical protein